MLYRFSRSVLLAGSAWPRTIPRMDQIVRRYFGEHKFMGTALVARWSQVLLDKAYGSANLEWDVRNTTAIIRSSVCPISQLTHEVSPS